MDSAEGERAKFELDKKKKKWSFKNPVDNLAFLINPFLYGGKKCKTKLLSHNNYYILW